MDKVFSISIEASYGSKLDIFLENQGGVCYGPKIGELKVLIVCLYLFLY